MNIALIRPKTRGATGQLTTLEILKTMYSCSAH